jgi:hypothetical protein
MKKQNRHLQKIAQTVMLSATLAETQGVKTDVEAGE